MIWGSFDEFVHMGGYGFYVWGSYGVTLAILVGETWMARRRHRRAIEAARRAASRNEAGGRS